MKLKSPNAKLKAALLGTGLLVASVVWLAGPLADKPVLAADRANDLPVKSLTGPRAQRVAVTEPLPERSTLYVDGADSPASAPHATPAFAKMVSGTWLEWYSTPEYSFQTMYNIRADGTFDWFGTWFFGDGSESYYDGPVYGSWKQTGPREMTTIEIGFLFNGDGSFYGTGLVIEVYTFDEDFQSFTYVGTEDIFLPDQDPTDPDAIPDQSFSFGPSDPINRLN